MLWMIIGFVQASSIYPTVQSDLSCVVNCIEYCKGLFPSVCVCVCVVCVCVIA